MIWFAQPMPIGSQHEESLFALHQAGVGCDGRRIRPDCRGIAMAIVSAVNGVGTALTTKFNAISSSLK